MSNLNLYLQITKIMYSYQLKIIPFILKTIISKIKIFDIVFPLGRRTIWSDTKMNCKWWSDEGERRRRGNIGLIEQNSEMPGNFRWRRLGESYLGDFSYFYFRVWTDRDGDLLRLQQLQSRFVSRLICQPWASWVKGW